MTGWKGGVILLALSAAACSSVSAQHVPLPEPEDGWFEVPLRLENALSPAGPLRCQLILAHWFEIGVGPVPAGGSTSIDLLVRPESGDVAILNDAGDRMRLERLACGRPDSGRASWDEPVLDALRTREGDTTLRCEGVGECHYMP